MYYVRELSSNISGILRQRTRFNYANTHAAVPSWEAEGKLSDLCGDESGSESDIGDAAAETLGGTVDGNSTAADPGNEAWPAANPVVGGMSVPRIVDPSDDTQLSRWIIPSFGEMPQHTNFNINHEERQGGGTQSVDFPNVTLPRHVRKHFYILCTSPTDVQLQPFDRNVPSVECKFVLTLHNHTRTTPPWDMHPAYAERMNMLIHVPELNLVVVGSPTGRVALLTLTRARRRIQNTPVRCGFRVDRVLPRKAEDDRRLRPACSLIGVAMSPVPDHRARGLALHPPGGARTTPPVMYRLILHYKDHTILMYDIARGLAEEDLMIF